MLLIFIICEPFLFKKESVSSQEPFLFKKRKASGRALFLLKKKCFSLKRIGTFFRQRFF